MLGLQAQTLCSSKHYLLHSKQLPKFVAPFRGIRGPGNSHSFQIQFKQTSFATFGSRTKAGSASTTIPKFPKYLGCHMTKRSTSRRISANLKDVEEMGSAGQSPGSSDDGLEPSTSGNGARGPPTSSNGTGHNDGSGLGRSPQTSYGGIKFSPELVAISMGKLLEVDPSIL